MVRRAVARHGKRGKPAATQSPEGRRRRCDSPHCDSPQRFNDGRWHCSSMLNDLRGEDGQVRQAVGAGEMQWSWGLRGLPGRRRQRRLARSSWNVGAFKGVRCRASRVAHGTRCLAASDRWAQAEGPVTGNWAHSYLICNQILKAENWILPGKIANGWEKFLEILWIKKM
jgi:hypothetical protein